MRRGGILSLTLSAMLSLVPIVAVMPVRAAPAPTRRPAAVDWTRRVTATAAGGFVMGNPAARVKLVEYLSMTCSHCAAFSTEGLPALRRDYVAHGLVSLEVRNAVRDGFDMTASLLARCGGAAAFFPATERMFAAQPSWLARAQAFVPSSATPDPASQIPQLARATGLDAMARAGGLPQARIDACLADRGAQARLAAMAGQAFGPGGISGTPGFAIDGTVQQATYDWTSLKPKLDALLR